jgi:hypothetical protein
MQCMHGCSCKILSFPRGSTAALLPLRNMTFVISGKLDKTKVGNLIQYAWQEQCFGSESV